MPLSEVIQLPISLESYLSFVLVIISIGQYLFVRCKMYISSVPMLFLILEFTAINIYVLPIFWNSFVNIIIGKEIIFRDIFFYLSVIVIILLSISFCLPIKITFRVKILLNFYSFEFLSLVFYSIIFYLLKNLFHFTLTTSIFEYSIAIIVTVLLILILCIKFKDLSTIITKKKRNKFFAINNVRNPIIAKNLLYYLGADNSKEVYFYGVQEKIKNALYVNFIIIEEDICSAYLYLYIYSRTNSSNILKQEIIPRIKIYRLMDPSLENWVNNYGINEIEEISLKPGVTYNKIEGNFYRFYKCFKNIIR